MQRLRLDMHEGQRNALAFADVIENARTAME
jgi:hypothetical protein